MAKPVHMMVRVANEARHITTTLRLAPHILERQPPRNPRWRMKQLAQRRMLLRRQLLVRIQHQHPIPRDVLQRRVTRRAEIIAPGKRMHLRPVLPGDLHRAIGRAGVHDDDLIREPAHRDKALAEKLLLILDDQADGEAWSVERGVWSE